MKFSPLALMILPLGAVLLSGCMLGPDFKLPGFTGGKKWKEGNVDRNARLPDDWWTLYGDGDLNRLVNRALAANNDIAAAKARVDTARALVGADRAQLFPRLDLNASAGISRASQDSVGAAASVELQSERYRSTFDLSYDPDIWGRARRTVEASASQSAAAEALLDAQRLGVAAEVCRQYFLLRGMDVQKTVLTDTISSREDSRGLLKSREEAGLADGLAASQSRAEVELSRNDLAGVDRQRGAAEHALAVLCGVSPSAFSIDPKVGPRKTLGLRAGLPAAVLNRRPDVRAAEYNLRAANARIGVAEAAFYPNFTLTASAGFESLGAHRFLDWQNRVLSLGAGVAQPVFNAGSNKANFDAAVSSRDEALAKYRTTLLTALREVEDALLDLKSISRSRAALDRALAASRDARSLAKERFDKGLTNYLEVIDADRTTLSTRLLLAQADAQEHIAWATLAKALGGGWSGK